MVTHSLLISKEISGETFGALRILCGVDLTEEGGETAIAVDFLLLSVFFCL